MELPLPSESRSPPCRRFHYRQGQTAHLCPRDARATHNLLVPTAVLHHPRVRETANDRGRWVRSLGWCHRSCPSESCHSHGTSAVSVVSLGTGGSAPSMSTARLDN